MGLSSLWLIKITENFYLYNKRGEGSWYCFCTCAKSKITVWVGVKGCTGVSQSGRSARSGDYPYTGAYNIEFHLSLFFFIFVFLLLLIFFFFWPDKSKNNKSIISSNHRSSWTTQRSAAYISYKSKQKETSRDLC